MPRRPCIHLHLDEVALYIVQQVHTSTPSDRQRALLSTPRSSAPSALSWSSLVLRLMAGMLLETKPVRRVPLGRFSSLIHANVFLDLGGDGFGTIDATVVADDALEVVILDGFEQTDLGGERFAAHSHIWSTCVAHSGSALRNHLAKCSNCLPRLSGSGSRLL